jgi:putative ABC transport system substrate-binding protein
MRRREFITVVGGVVAAWPMAARAQQPLIGYLSGRSPEAEPPMLAGFWKGLAEIGYVENRNVAVEFRFANGHLDRVSALAADLVRGQPAVIVAVGGTGIAGAVRAVNSQAPIVFTVGSDPVQLGLVASFNRPGGNMTGVYAFLHGLAPKNLGLLHELAPKASSVAMLWGQTSPATQLQEQEGEARDAAASLGLRLRLFHATVESELDAAYAALLRQPPDALLVMTGPLLISRARQVAEFVTRLGIPAVYNRRNFAVAGGLMSYGDNVGESYRYTGIYTGRILKGERPVDLPVFQPKRQDLVINLKTAKAMNIAIPPTMLALADELIE